MKSISTKNIYLGYILGVAFALTIFLGIFNWPFFIFAIILLLSYIAFDRKRLRCPNCGGFENLDRLLYAKNHIYHCRHCGERISISK